MNTRSFYLRTSLLLLSLLSTVATYAEELTWSADFRVGGCGGAYFLAEPGEFWVEVEKQDRNIYGRKTHLRAILFGPDRSVVAEEILPWMALETGSGTGPVQRIRLAVTVPRAGIYGLSITASEDRYGEDVVWGLRTNCPKYLVETSRGHKDERHQEPIVLANGDVPGSLCFLPRSTEFTLDLAGFRGATVHVLDGAGTRLAAIPVDGDGHGTWTASSDIPRGPGPWRLEFSAANGTVNIDGVTRWDEADGGNSDLSLWSPRPETWFAFHENRWLLTPYRQQVHVSSPSTGRMAFKLHNNGREAKTIALDLSFPVGDEWNAGLEATEVRLGPGETVPVSLEYTVSPRIPSHRAYIRATSDDGFSTYATVEVIQQSEASDAPETLPLVLRPYHHENALFGYAPHYPVTNEVYFDRDNHPVITSRRGIATNRGDGWHTTMVDTALSSKVAFDGAGGIFVVGWQAGESTLYHFQDGGATRTARSLPEGGYYDMEQFSGHNTPAGPPPLVRFTRTASDPKRIWRRINDVDLMLPERHADGAITVGEPIRLSSMGIGISSHSGIPSSVVSRGSKVHVVWGEATDPEVEVPGVPTYVATYDRDSGTTTEPALVGYGPPANDVHNTPSITMDSQGYLHVLIGTHGQAFLYARSLQPNDARGGWTDPEPLGAGLRQTYVGFVCDPEDTLHVVFRLWNTDTTYFPASIYASLSYMQKKSGAPWSAPRALVVPPFSEYSVYYHRLTIDREGVLFLSYDYWSTYWFYRTDRRETRRALMMSRDRGTTWSLVDNDYWVGGPKDS